MGGSTLKKTFTSQLIHSMANNREGGIFSGSSLRGVKGGEGLTTTPRRVYLGWKKPLEGIRLVKKNVFVPGKGHEFSLLLGEAFLTDVGFTRRHPLFAI